MRASRGPVDRWTVALLFAAMLLPTLIFAALQIGFEYRTERRALETAALDRADAVITAVDGTAERTKVSALALATSVAIRHHDWRGAYDRAREIAALNPDWRAVRLIDADRGRLLFDTRDPFAGSPSSPGGSAQPAHALRVRFGDVRNDGRGCTCVMVQTDFERGGHLRLIVLTDPALIQRQLMARAPTEGVSGVVDRRGHFIGRTADFAQRVGNPATVYVRDAIRAGRRGIYPGITYEKLRVYTAFSTSALTGWSAHIAVPSAQFEAPTWRSRFAIAVAVLISLLLAAALGVGLMRVIAAQRAADLRFQQALRLEAVGQMTGGIAHDFNNMLAIVIGSLDLAQRRLAAGSPDIGRFVDNAVEGARRAAELTRRLLAFSRRQALSPVAADLNQLITAMGELIGRTVTENIALHLDLAPDLWRTRIDPGQFENAIVNLTANARDAMPRGGTLTISSANVALAPAEARALGLAPGDYTQVSVTDTGTGMSDDIMRRAFEPFFTTKEVGRGTGLGLSQIYGFLDQSGGRAHITSAVGAGTTIALYVPRFDGALAGDAGPSAPAASPPKGRPEDTILVVEDEPLVRRTSVEALRELGYSVRDTGDAADALRILAAEPTIALLLTDIVMPGMSGRELAAAARRRMPGLRILLATGYEREETGAEGQDERVLRKPFSLDRLAWAVREALDA